jgi:hypothetical protein
MARAPAQYPGFCMWLWMLSPFVRRVVDWETSYNVISPVMLAPLLASSLSVWTAIRVGPRLLSGVFLPFSAVIGVCVYGLFLGAVQAGPVAAVYAWLNWVAPVFVGIHILARPRLAAETAMALFGAMSWGTLVIGSYGVWQYFEPQQWDIFWMAASEFTTAGLPLPQQIRVFSTMNSPAPFAYVMMAGLIVLLGEGQTIRWFAATPGLTAFALSLVRSAWGGFVIALGVIVLCSPIKQKGRYVALGALLVALALPLLTVGPIAEVVQARLDSVSAIDRDSSYLDRMSFYADFLSSAFGTPLGAGLGVTGLASRLGSTDGSLGEFGIFDSGVMDVFFTFGWLGAILLVSAGFITWTALKAASRNSYALSCAAIASGTVAQMMFSDTLIGASGMLVFPFAALATVQSRRQTRPSPASASMQSRRMQKKLVKASDPIPT